MALVVKDRVKVTTTTTGTGTLTLGSAVTKFQDFSVIGDGNTTYYSIESGNGTDWEIGVGTYTASGTTLSRDTILESSNAGSAINLSGTSTVFCTYPAERSVNTADIGSTIQGYDADTAKYDDTTANFTGNLQKSGANVLTANQTITLSGDVTGSGATSITTTVGNDSHSHTTSTLSGNVSAFTNDSGYITGNQTITLSGDASGSGTTAITVTVADDSHNHIIGNVDGLQAALDAKAPTASPSFTGTATFDTNVLYVDSSGNRVGINNNATDITGTSLDQLIVGNGSGNNGMVIDSLAGGQSRYGFSEAGTIKGGIQYDGTSNQIEFMVEGIATEVASINSAGKLSTTSISLNGTDVTATATELNYTDGVTSNIQTQLNAKQPLDADLTAIGGLAKTNGNFIVGNGTTWVAESGATARTSLGLGSLATLSTVNAATITDNSVGAAELNVSGNGTTSQYLRSDGDGTFTWATPPSITTTTGSPAYYAARAWVNFNGTGTVAIRADVNVSSITDLDTGEYQVNFTTAMPDTNYCTLGSAIGTNSAGDGMFIGGFGSGTIKATTYIKIKTSYGPNNASYDTNQTNVAVFR